MSNTAVAVVTLSIETFPIGTLAGGVKVELVDSTSGNVAQTQVIATGQLDVVSQATFVIADAGTWTVHATRLDGNNAPLGNTVSSGSFVTTGPTTINITVPTNVTVNVA